MDVRGFEERGRCRQADEGPGLAKTDRQGVARLPLPLLRFARPLTPTLSPKGRGRKKAPANGEGFSASGRSHRHPDQKS
jgi:hypothetical protein